ncbi:MAG: ATP-binding protein [Planctomycetes bacterium]|nr:ATP-binding protein [Planctomycetota bacterium]
MPNNDNLLFEKTPEDIRELERYIKDFSLFLPMPVCVVTPTRIIMDINKAFRDLTGYQDLDIVGQPLEILFRRKDRVDSMFSDLNTRGRIENREMEIIIRRGQLIPVNLSAAVRRDDEENVIGYFFAWADIRELRKLHDSLEEKVKKRTHELEEMQKILIKTLDQVKSAKAKIEKERNKTAAIIANFVDPVMVVDNDYRLILANPAAQKIFRLSPKCLGRKLSAQNIRFSCEDFRSVIKIDFKVKELKTNQAGSPTVEEMIVKQSQAPAKEENNPFRAASAYLTGEEIVYKVITAPVSNEQNMCFGRMKIFYDLTREKMIDLLKSEFISIAAHQLRTPLSAIKWSLRMTLDGDAGRLNDEQEKILLKGYVSNERVINLINEMLHVSRIEEGKFGYQFAPDDISSVIDELARDLKSQIKVKNIKFNFLKPKGLFTALVDREKIKLALGHLLENAIKYTPDYGKVEVEMKKGNTGLKIVVRDNGVGIPKAEQLKLYTKFFRAENVVRLQTDGSGLGLFIAKNIIDRHGGTIVCRSNEGRGTEFTVTLPPPKPVRG